MHRSSISAADAAQASSRDPLPVVAGQINALFDRADRAARKSDDFRISAGQLLIEARKRVEAGEAEYRASWTQWREDNIKRSEGDCRKVMQIAGAVEPAAELAAQRERNRQNNIAHRARSHERAHEPEPVDLARIAAARKSNIRKLNAAIAEIEARDAPEPEPERQPAVLGICPSSFFKHAERAGQDCFHVTAEIVERLTQTPSGRQALAEKIRVHLSPRVLKKFIEVLQGEPVTEGAQHAAR